MNETTAFFTVRLPFALAVLTIAVWQLYKIRKEKQG